MQYYPKQPESYYAEDTAELDLREYLRILGNFRWGIFSLALLSGLIGLYVALKSEPIYRSTVKLQISRESTVVNLGDMLLQPSQAKEFYNTQYEMIKSWGVAEQAATMLGLQDVDQPVKKSGSSARVAGFSLQQFIAGLLNTQPPVLTSDQRRNDAITKLQENALVTPVKDSELVNISFESPDPEFAARQANAVAASYIEFIKNMHLEDITSNQHWFASRLEQGRLDLEKAETALQDFRERNAILETAEGVGTAQSQRLQLAFQGREQAHQQKLKLEDLYQQISKARNDPGHMLASITALQSRGVVAQLKNDYQQAGRKFTELSRRYGPRHPRMIEVKALLDDARQSYDEELELAADGITADYQRAQREEASLGSKLNEAEAGIIELNRSRAELNKLENNVQSSRALYEQLQTGIKATGMMEGGIQKINAMIFEYARPGLYPVRPNKPRMVSLWTLFGLVLGVGVAFMLNRLDNTFKDSNDVERRLLLPVMGLIPQLEAAKKDEISALNHFEKDGYSTFSEAIRTVRSRVMLARLEQPNSTIVVTSSLPGEGKTTLAINLAHSISKIKKCLLIDLDLRKPVVRKIENIRRSRPGITAWITGEAEIKDILSLSSSDNLQVIAAGDLPPNPLDLLVSHRLTTLIEQLKQQYEYIIIDSPPVLAISDTLVLSQLVDVVLYMVRADKTPYQAAEQGIKRLRQLGAPLMGVVMNQVTSQSRGYNYGRYYRYGMGYQADEVHDYYGESAK